VPKRTQRRRERREKRREENFNHKAHKEHEEILEKEKNTKGCSLRISVSNAVVLQDGRSRK
jgi:hypothetical protein